MEQCPAWRILYAHGSQYSAGNDAGPRGLDRQETIMDVSQQQNYLQALIKQLRVNNLLTDGLHCAAYQQIE
jgi:hypothetical protein